LKHIPKPPRHLSEEPVVEIVDGRESKPDRARCCPWSVSDKKRGCLVCQVAGGSSPWPRAHALIHGLLRSKKAGDSNLNDRNSIR
jgi:hypothetical protein